MSDEMISLPIRAAPYEHQRRAAAFALDRLSHGGGAALLMEMGTGKTLTSIGIVGQLWKERRIARLLIVAPLSILGVWRDEFDKFAGYDYCLSILEGTAARKADTIRHMAGKSLQVLVINYESAWRMEKELAEWQPDMIVCDEGHKIKTHNIAASKAMHRLAGKAKYRLLDKSLDDCQEIITNLKAGYPNLTRWQEKAKAAGAKCQYTQTFLGRRRYLPGIRSQDWGRKSFGERCALNTPIQGTAADILKLSLGRLIAGLPDRPWLKPLLQIHDELVFELPEERLTEAVAFIQECMDAKPFPELDVPLVAEASWGYDFGHMNEME